MMRLRCIQGTMFESHEFQEVKRIPQPQFADPKVDYIVRICKHCGLRKQYFQVLENPERPR